MNSVKCNTVESQIVRVCVNVELECLGTANVQAMA